MDKYKKYENVETRNNLIKINVKLTGLIKKNIFFISLPMLNAVFYSRFEAHTLTLSL